jgi:hypothetical protein
MAFAGESLFSCYPNAVTRRVFFVFLVLRRELLLFLRGERVCVSFSHKPFPVLETDASNRKKRDSEPAKNKTKSMPSGGRTDAAAAGAQV